MEAFEMTMVYGRLPIYLGALEPTGHIQDQLLECADRNGFPHTHDTPRKIIFFSSEHAHTYGAPRLADAMEEFLESPYPYSKADIIGATLLLSLRGNSESIDSSHLIRALDCTLGLSIESQGWAHSWIESSPIVALTQILSGPPSELRESVIYLVAMDAITPLVCWFHDRPKESLIEFLEDANRAARGDERGVALHAGAFTYSLVKLLALNDGAVAPFSTNESVNQQSLTFFHERAAGYVRQIDDPLNFKEVLGAVDRHQHLGHQELQELQGFKGVLTRQQCTNLEIVHQLLLDEDIPSSLQEPGSLALTIDILLDSNLDLELVYSSGVLATLQKFDCNLDHEALSTAVEILQSLTRKAAPSLVFEAISDLLGHVCDDKLGDRSGTTLCPNVIVKRELGILNDFFDEFGVIPAVGIYSEYRKFKLQLDPSPENQVSPEDRAKRSVDKRLDLDLLREYVSRRSEEFVLDPGTFETTGLIDCEIVSNTCRLFRSPVPLPETEVHKIMTDRRKVNREISIFEQCPRNLRRETTVRRVVRRSDTSNPRKSRDLRFEGELQLLKKVADQGSQETLRSLLSKFGPDLESGAGDLKGVAVRKGVIALVESMSLAGVTDFSEKVLRQIFYLHTLGDPSSRATAIQLCESRDPIARMCGFVELVGTAANESAWKKVLSSCSDPLREAFSAVTDTDYLLERLIPLLRPPPPPSPQAGTQTSAEEVRIAFRLTRERESYAIGPICNSCIRESLDEYPNMAFVSFAEMGKGEDARKSNRASWTTFSGGCMLIHTELDDGRTALILRGYNPILTLLMKIDIRGLFHQFMNFVEEDVAPLVGADVIVAPWDVIPGRAFSNRPLAHLDFKELIRMNGGADGTPEFVSLSDPRTTFNGFDIRDRCVVVPKDRRNVDGTDGDAITKFEQ